MRFFNRLYPYFFPHPHTHQKARLLSWHYLIIYILLFMLFRVSIDLVTLFKPGVLGVDSTITVEQIIKDTNKQRTALGLPELRENTELDKAAQEKAKNMFAEGYWAHFSPTGKDPWGFISGQGYKFTYAGENLARNFYTSSDVVQAWMNSTSHRENIVNNRYQDIGIAVAEGVLQGQKTTLIVQMFGTPTNVVVRGPQLSNESAQRVAVQSEPARIQGTNVSQEIVKQSSFDPIAVTRIIGFALIGFMALLLMIDLLILKKRGVFRLSSHHIAHLSFLALAGISIIVSKAGEIL